MLILCYSPKASHSGIDADWLYGYDLILEIKKMHPEWNYFTLRGLSRNKMREAYVYSSCLLRPTRHDGYSFSVQEALHYGLPVLHTYPIPGVILIKPEINDIEEKLLKLSEDI